MTVRTKPKHELPIADLRNKAIAWREEDAKGNYSGIRKAMHERVERLIDELQFLNDRLIRSQGNAKS